MPVSDDQVLRDRLELEMLERPHLWPTIRRGMPCVFLKRGHANAETGPCFKTGGSGYVVMAHDWEQDGKVTAHSYNCAEAVLADGWRVD